MNDQAAQMMNKSQIMNQSQMMNRSQMLSMNQPQILNQPQSQMLSQPQLMNQAQAQMMMNRGGGYGMWPPPPVDQLKFQNPPMNHPGFVPSKQSKSLGGRGNWKGKKGNDKRKDGRRKDKPLTGVGAGGSGSGSSGGGGGGGGGGYKPPTLQELQHQNRLKARRFFSKKKFNNRSAPFAPRNTSSFIIRAKKSGGIASLVSPCPVTPAVLPTPIFSPSREVLVDMAKEEWGVDGYGSMKGLIRLRSPGNEAEEEEEEDGGSSESDVEEHLEVERRLDHDLSRFEMIYPNHGADHNNVLENRVDDQDTHIAQLEEENLILKERLFLMEREFSDLRRRLQCLERRNQAVEEINEEVVENESENESESRGEARFHNSRLMEENIEEVVEENNEGGHVQAKDENNDQEVEAKEENNVEATDNEDVGDVPMEELGHEHEHDEVFAENRSKVEGAGNECSEKSIGDGD